MLESDLVQKGKQIDRKQIDQAVDDSIHLNVPQGCAAFFKYYRCSYRRSLFWRFWFNY